MGGIRLIMRLFLHSALLVLLAFEGAASGMVLCIGHDGHIRINTGCNQDRCCTLASCIPGDAVLGEGYHRCCVDITLPEITAEAAKSATNDHTLSLHQHQVRRSRHETVSRFSTAHVNRHLPIASSVGTIVLLI
jgi:hypothetical protein